MDTFLMFARGGTLILYIRVYMNYNGVFLQNVASTIVHCICIIEKLYTETPDRPNIKSCYLRILSLFNKKILGDIKLKIRVTFFVELERKYLTKWRFPFYSWVCILFNKFWFISPCRHQKHPKTNPPFIDRSLSLSSLDITWDRARVQR